MIDYGINSSFTHNGNLKTHIERAKREILNVFKKHKVPISKTQISNLDFFSKRIYNLLSSSKNFIFQKNKTILHTPTKTSILYKKLIPALSLSTLKLFQLLIRSNITPKNFSPNEKLLISKLLKNTKIFPSHKILSNKIRSLAS